MKELKLFIKDMKAEAAVLKSFARLEDEMQNLAGNKKWESIEPVIQNLQDKAQKLNKIEDNRCASFRALKQKLGAPADATFLKILPLIPSEKRDELLKAYRELKIAVFSVKGASARLTYYFKSIEQSFKKVLGELFPHRKGKIYAKDGRAKKVPDDTLLLNKHL
jgi:hypothetical protein